MLILTDGQFDDMATIRKSLKNSTIMVLSEEELDKIEVNWDKLKTTVKSIYRARQVVYTGKQKQLFKNINNFIIPDYYFNNELKEVGENW